MRKKSKLETKKRCDLAVIHKRLVDEDYIVILGNIEPRKSHLELAKAVDYINNSLNKAVNLVIVGSPIHKTTQITKDIKKILGSRVIFTGYLKDSVKKSIISIYCLPRLCVKI